MISLSYSQLFFLIFLASVIFFSWRWYSVHGLPSDLTLNLGWLKKLASTKVEIVLFLGGIALLIASQVLGQSLPDDKRLQSLPFLVIGFVFFLLGAWAIQRDGLAGWLLRLFDRMSSWLKVQPAQIVYLLLGAAFAVAAVLAAWDGGMMRNLPLAIIAWILGITLTLLGAWDNKGSNKANYAQVFRWMALFFIVGFLVRGIDLANIPKVLTGDESLGGLSAVDFVTDRMDNIFVIGWYDFPSLYFYVQSLSISLFGQTVAALRIPAALVGGLTVAALYLMGRVFYSHLTGILAATFLAGFHYHIHFSRLGLNNIFDGLFYVLVWGALWYGWKNKSRSAFLIAGVALGFSQYFYVSSRALFGLIPIWIVIVSLMDRRRLRDNAVNVILMSLTTIVVMLPLAWFFNTHRDQFQAPLVRFSILSGWLVREVEFSGLPIWKILWEQFKISFQAFTTRPITQWYQPGVPLLRSFPAGIFIAGLALLLLRWKEARTVLITLWLGAFVFIGAMSTPVPAAQRYVAAAPAIALVLGFSLGEIANMLTKAWAQKAKFIGAVAIGVVILLAVDDARFYFLDFTVEKDFSDANTWIAQNLADHLQDRDGGWQVAFFGSPRMGYRSIATLPYLAPHIEGFDMNQAWGSPENPELTSNKLIFVFLPDNEDNLNAVRIAYPNGQLSEEYFDNGVFLYWLYEVVLPDS